MAYVLHQDIAYTHTNHHERQVLDLYIPESGSTHSSSHEPIPVILYVHGGAFKFGDKQGNPELLPLHQVSRGLAVAATNYRRSGEAIFPAMIEDCKSAIRFLKSPAMISKYNLDPNRLVAWGESAGGHAVAMLGATSDPSPRGRFDVGEHLDISSSVRGVIDYYGPTDFLKMDEHLPEGFRTHNNADSPESLYLGGQITEIPERVKEADPCTYVSELVERYHDRKDIPKFFIAHGTEDRIVPEYMSFLLLNSLKDSGIDVKYLPVEGTDHVFRGINDEQQMELDTKTNEFLTRIANT